MNINRHNYEAILLDYLEGRLTAEEAAEADAFMEQNPDILAEFQSLKIGFDLPDLAVSSPDFSYLKQPVEPTIVLDADIVEKLAHPEDPSLPGIDVSRLIALHPELAGDIALLRVSKVQYTQEQANVKPQKIWADDVAPIDALAVLAAEGDLNPAQLRTLRSFAPTDWAQKVNALLATKLVPEAISHPDKSTLYRTPVVAIWYRSDWVRVAAAVLLLLGGWFLLSPSPTPEGRTAQMAEINVHAPKMAGQLVTDNIALPEKQDEKVAAVKDVSLIHSVGNAAPDLMTFRTASVTNASLKKDLLYPAAAVTAFTPWNDGEEVAPLPSPVSGPLWEQLAMQGVDRLLNLDRNPNQSLTSALINKATAKLNESEKVLVQLPGPKPEKRLAGWKVRLGQLQIAKQDR